MEEIWRYVPGYERLYEVSNTGKVRKADGKEMAGNLNSYGYRVVSLTRNGKKKDKKVHRLVAMAFIDQVPGKDFVNHKDGNKTNNAVWNLEWVTRGENNRHAREVLHANYSKKEVVKLDGDFRRLSEYESRSKAGKSVGAKNGFLIGACCLGTAKTAHGYRWAYKKTCPVRMILNDFDRERSVCLFGDCAIYDKENNCCSVLSISRGLNK